MWVCRHNGEDRICGRDSGIGGEAEEVVARVERRLDSAGGDDGVNGQITTKTLVVEDGGAANKAEEVICAREVIRLGGGERQMGEEGER